MEDLLEINKIAFRPEPGVLRALVLRAHMDDSAP